MHLVTAADSGSLRINSQALAWADVVEFDEAHAAVRASPGAALTPGQADALRQAVALYGEGLPSGRFQEWARAEALRLRQTYLAMLEQLMEYSEARGEYSEGLHHGRTVLRHDPARETAHRRLMILHDRSGDRAAAIRQYHVCAEALAREFGVRPSAETVALYRRLTPAAGEGEPAAEPPAAVIPLPSAAPDAESLSALQLRLEKIKITLASLYENIDQPTDGR
jgi:DNA-binding SARP family transcriptional activator